MNGSMGYLGYMQVHELSTSVAHRERSVKSVASPGNLSRKDCTFEHWSGTRSVAHGKARLRGKDKVMVLSTYSVSSLHSACLGESSSKGGNLASLLVLAWKCCLTK